MRTTRTIIFLSEDEKLWLEEYSKAAGVSMAETIRRGLARLREQERPGRYHEALESTRGLWKKGDGLREQESLRRDWQ